MSARMIRRAGFLRILTTEKPGVPYVGRRMPERVRYRIGPRGPDAKSKRKIRIRWK